MPVSDFYTATFTPTVASASVTAVGSLIANTTKRAWCVGVRCRIVTTSAAAGSTVLIQLARPANTPTLTTLSTVAGNDYAAPASISQIASTWSTAPTVSTAVGGVPAAYELPLAPGAMWAEFPPQGAEWGVPALGNTAANTGLHLFVTASVATSATYGFDLIFSE